MFQIFRFFFLFHSYLQNLHEYTSAYRDKLCEDVRDNSVVNLFIAKDKEPCKAFFLEHQHPCMFSTNHHPSGWKGAVERLYMLSVASLIGTTVRLCVCALIWFSADRVAAAEDRKGDCDLIRSCFCLTGVKANVFCCYNLIVQCVENSDMLFFYIVADFS